MTATQTEIKAIFDLQAQAIRSKDLDRLMSFYSPDVVYFDVVPPLRYVGAAALRSRFTEWFEGYAGPLGMEIRDLQISAESEMAIAHWISKVSGTLKNGREVGSWARVTSCCQRSDQGWLITHEHVSFPVDMKSGSAILDSVP
jgi:uncharacterized protein (TIGR02246 family)